MKVDWDTVPLWPLYVGVYVIGGTVVSQSLDVVNRRQCAASSPSSCGQKIVAGVAWPVTAAGMMLLGADPFAILTWDPNEPPNT